MRIVALAAAAALVSACASSSTHSGPTCKIAGTWALKFSPDASDPGTCNFSDPLTAETVTITETSATTVNVRYQGSTGTGCDGNRDGCTITVECEGSDGQGGTSTRQDSWHFSDTAMTGTSDFSYRPYRQPSCTDNLAVSGTRK